MAAPFSGLGVDFQTAPCPLLAPQRLTSPEFVGSEASSGCLSSKWAEHNLLQSDMTAMALLTETGNWGAGYKTYD